MKVKKEDQIKEEKFKKFEDEFREFIKEAKHKTNNVARNQAKLMNKFSKLLDEVKKMILSHDKILKSVAEVSASSDQTLMNVLLAIKQNEYLQAWYPAQGSYPAMKVVGKHPLESRKEI